jgi:hypothetical protein
MLKVLLSLRTQTRSPNSSLSSTPTYYRSNKLEGRGEERWVRTEPVTREKETLSEVDQLGFVRRR